MIFFSSDHHFAHRNIIKFIPRDFSSVSEMDEALIRLWNQTVSPNDTIYHLGDFTLGGQEMARGYFRRLNGTIKAVPGGHDHRWCKTHWLGKMGNYFSAQGVPVEILHPLHTLKTQGVVVVLCHWAMKTWHLSHHGSYHLFGHSHSRLSGDGRSMDVGVDAHHYRPVSLPAIIQELNNGN